VLSTLLAIAGASVAPWSIAQTPLKPPQPPQGSQLQQPGAKPAAASSAPTALTAPKSSSASTPAAPARTSAPAASVVSGGSTNMTRFKMVKVDGKLLDLRTMPDSTVLKGKSGRTISVAQIKQLQARIDGASTTPMITAKKGQSLKSLAAAPAGTLVALPGGRIVRSQDLGKAQALLAKLSEKRVLKPVPVSLKNVQATAIVGQGLTLAEALKRPASDVIQVGSRKYTAEQLRQMDALLKASPREPRGLLDRAAAVGGRTGNAPATAKLPGGDRLPAGQMPAKNIRKGDGK